MGRKMDSTSWHKVGQQGITTAQIVAVGCDDDDDDIIIIWNASR
jgi:hypothetical protein